jgi:hypothetical protein
MARIQTDPRAQQIMPALFLARGMGKPEGGNMVWDISIAHGRVTINGAPMGGGGGSPARPPGR